MKDKFFTVLNNASCHEHFGVEVQLGTLLTLTLAGKEWLDSCSGHFTSPGNECIEPVWMLWGTEKSCTLLESVYDSSFWPACSLVSISAEVILTQLHFMYYVTISGEFL